MLRALFLDLDGTLTDPREGITRCIAHALGRLGETAPDLATLERFIGPPLAQAFSELLRSDDPARIAAAIAAYRDRFGTVGIYENQVIPGIPDALESISESGVRLCVVTSKPTVYAERIIEHFGLTGWIGAVYGAELDGTRSNKAELVRRALDLESLAPSSVWMVGDREHDVHGARACGVPTLAVTWGFGSRDELEAAGADAIAERVSDLATWARGEW